MPSPDELRRRAIACAALLSGSATSEDPAFTGDFHLLLEAIRQSHQRYAFERAGRPEAIAAVRQALPAVEQALLDAIIEDLGCEASAVQEAMYHVALAARASRDGPVE